MSNKITINQSHNKVYACMYVFIKEEEEEGTLRGETGE